MVIPPDLDFIISIMPAWFFWGLLAWDIVLLILLGIAAVLIWWH